MTLNSNLNVVFIIYCHKICFNAENISEQNLTHVLAAIEYSLKKIEMFVYIASHIRRNCKKKGLLIGC